MLDGLFQETDREFSKVLEHLREEYTKLQIGRASAAIVEGISVEAYGSKQALKAVASVSCPDAKTIQIQPWDRSLLSAIEKAIQVSDLNLNPLNDGVYIRLNIPPLTEERRRDLAKVVHKMEEESRIGIRHARQKFLDQMKSMEKDSKITEDQVKSFEKKLQEKVDKYNSEIETSAKKKEQDIMTI